MGPLELGGLVLQPLRPLEAEADADVVARSIADGQLALGADAAAQQDPRRAVGAGGQHDGPRAQLADRRRDTNRTIAGQQDAVNKRVGEDRQVLASARRIKVGEPRVPADGADRVDRCRIASSPAAAANPACHGDSSHGVSDRTRSSRSARSRYAAAWRAPAQMPA
jgi:hypothetical protein